MKRWSRWIRAKPSLVHPSRIGNATWCPALVKSQLLSRLPVEIQVPHCTTGYPKISLYGSVLALNPSPDAPSGWLVLSAVIGLPAALWAYKCLMMVLLQRKIIYMGYIPPSARTEELGQIMKPSKDISCEKIRIEGEKNVVLYGLLVRKNSVKAESIKTVLVYFQGNAGNPLGRIPVFERLLLGSSLSPQWSSKPEALDETAILAVAPRSYWKSSTRTPTERGLISDYTRAIVYAIQHFPSASIVLYGHSLGGAAAVCLSARLKAKDFPNVKGLILENPFASIPGMVEALYPQRWLPYHYLGRFAFDTWDALSAMRNRPSDSLLYELSSRMMVILSQKDEIVPGTMGRSLFNASVQRPGRDAGGDEAHGPKRLVVIDGALHENAWQRRKWRTVMGEYVSAICSKPILRETRPER